jgi:hypothetical protein
MLPLRGELLSCVDGMVYHSPESNEREAASGKRTEPSVLGYMFIQA